MKQNKKHIIKEMLTSDKPTSYDLIALKADCEVSYVKSVEKEMRRKESEPLPVQGEGFTPGEWEACKNNDGWPDLPIWTTIDIGNGILQNECVATVWANDKAEANARLICQAPAMYVALKAMSQNYSLLLGSIDDANENDYSLLTEAEAILSRIQLNK